MKLLAVVHGGNLAMPNNDGVSNGIKNLWITLYKHSAISSLVLI
jgi:hypothetical protein